MFFAKGIEIAKDKMGMYNNLLSPPMKEKTNSEGFKKFLEFIIHILQNLGWLIYVALAGLVALGFYAYFAGMGTLVAINPLLAAALAVLGGNGVYLIWRHREFLQAQKEIGDQYKEKFDSILENYSENEQIIKIESLMEDCVKSLCIHAYQINSDDANEKIFNNFREK